MKQKMTSRRVAIMDNTFHPSIKTVDKLGIIFSTNPPKIHLLNTCLISCLSLSLCFPVSQFFWFTLKTSVSGSWPCVHSVSIHTSPVLSPCIYYHPRIKSLLLNKRDCVAKWKIMYTGGKRCMHHWSLCRSETKSRTNGTRRKETWPIFKNWINNSLTKWKNKDGAFRRKRIRWTFELKNVF